MVYLSVPDKNLRGNHRVTSKTITVGETQIKCTLGLDKRSPALADYIERKIKL